tara:strand:+ start:644 stop:1531 length:888 start_codon:yes stop_codon:yes gene_type:complete
MKNTHLQHPEDSILTGDLSVLDWFLSESELSVKIDGSPAIVWGTNPATGNFFVGTKSVFNKVKIKINETHDDIDRNHSGVVADILHHCFDCLPSFDGIVQGDFIGFGGDDTFCPNTITYIFDEIIDQNIIVAPHTLYATDGELKDAYTIMDMVDMEVFDDTETCKFVQPRAWQIDEDFAEIVGFARQMSQLVSFAEPIEAEKIKIDLNRCIREGREVDPDSFNNSRLISYWFLIKSIKEDMLFLCRNNGPKAYIDNKQCGGEGYVRTNDHGMFKLVNREQFSHANFNNMKHQCAS